MKERRSSPGDLDKALYNEDLPQWQSLMKEMVLACLNCFIFMVNVNISLLLRVNQGLNNFFRKGCLGREAHRLNTRYLISMQNSRFYATRLVVMGLSGVVMVTCSRTGRAWQGALCALQAIS